MCMLKLPQLSNFFSNFNMLLFLLLYWLSVGDNDLECVYTAGSCMLTFFFNRESEDVFYSERCNTSVKESEDVFYSERCNTSVRESEDVFYSERCNTSVLPWIIAGSLFGLLLIIGILALICLIVAYCLGEK